MGFSESAERHDRLQRELAEERVTALLRISRRSLASSRPCAAAWRRPGARPIPGRPPPIATCAEAVKYRWYLEVQRDALGLHDHRRLDEFYRVPPLEP